VVYELLDDFKVDVSLKQCEANFAQRFVNVLLGERGLAAESFECALEFFLKILKHGSIVLFYQREEDEAPVFRLVSVLRTIHHRDAEVHRDQDWKISFAAMTVLLWIVTVSSTLSA